MHQTIGLQVSRLFQFLLVGIALAGPGWQFFEKGVPSLLRRAPDMNALVALGTFAAFAYSSVVTFAPGLLPPVAQNVYFEAAGVIVVLILFGRMLEARAKGRANSAIRALADLQPDTARVLVDGKEIERPVAALKTADLIRVLPGERIPTDGTVTAGTSQVDEAMISGEPIPVAKTEGDTVTGATINGTGVLTIRADRVGEDTVLSGIIRLVRDAQGTKLPIEAMIDRVTAWFVPAVLLAALVTLALWLMFSPTLAIVAAVSVLIIACPCAMGLAVPTSIMVGMGRAAEAGVLFRQGEAIERLPNLATVAFDKTGTLTLGKPALAHIEALPGFDKDTVLSAAAAVEAQSQHPIARAVTEAAKDVPPATDVTTVTGQGISGSVNGQTIRIGNAKMMQGAGIDVAPLTDAYKDRSAKGETAFYVAMGDQLAALIAVADPIKPRAKATIDALHRAGLKTAMISGDGEATARAVAAELGIDTVIAEALPDNKLAHIKALAEDGPVAFVGDGINDAPALAAADIGIALGTGTDVAMETADVVLMSGDPQGVVTALGLSKAVMRNVRQNLGWAFGYNALLIPVAAGVLYPAFGILLSPMLAAAAMALSSVAVVTNALRLKGVRRMNIGDASEAAGLPAKTIRYYEDIGLVRPGRNKNGYRSFSETDLHKLQVPGPRPRVGLFHRRLPRASGALRRRKPRQFGSPQDRAAASGRDRGEDRGPESAAGHAHPSGRDLRRRRSPRLPHPAGPWRDISGSSRVDCFSKIRVAPDPGWARPVGHDAEHVFQKHMRLNNLHRIDMRPPGGRVGRGPAVPPGQRFVRRVSLKP